MEVSDLEIGKGVKNFCIGEEFETFFNPPSPTFVNGITLSIDPGIIQFSMVKEMNSATSWLIEEVIFFKEVPPTLHDVCVIVSVHSVTLDSLMYYWVKCYQARSTQSTQDTLSTAQSVLSLSHTKARLDWHQPSPAFHWHAMDYKLVIYRVHRLHFIVGVIPKEGLVRLVPTRPPFGMTMTKTCFCMTWPKTLTLIIPETA